MEQAGLIAGYRAVVPLKNQGLSIIAFIRVVGASNDRYYERMQTAVRAMPRVLEAHVAGPHILSVVHRRVAPSSTSCGCRRSTLEFGPRAPLSPSIFVELSLGSLARHASLSR
jgi:hypothetical protein